MIRSKVWNTSVFREKASSFSLLAPTFEAPVLQLINNKIRNEARFIHTIADPFLSIFDDEIYLFAETKRAHDHGKISAWRSSNGINWNSLGEVFSTDFHCSYPFNFSVDGDRLMIPETGSDKKLSIWKSQSFPRDWVAGPAIFDGTYCDSSVIKWEDRFFLFTNPNLGETLEVYHSKSINGPWIAHPENPVVRGHSISRNGGGPIRWKNKLYRFSQDCSKSYGEKLSLHQISSLSPDSYTEKTIVKDFLPRDKPWNRFGGHHFNFVEFGEFVFYAVDGKGYGHLLNKLMGLMFRLAR